MAESQVITGTGNGQFLCGGSRSRQKWYSEWLVLSPTSTFRADSEFRIGDYQHELGIIDAAFAPAGATKILEEAIAYWHVDDLQASLDNLVARGAKPYQPITDHSGGKGRVCDGLRGGSFRECFGHHDQQTLPGSSAAKNGIGIFGNPFSGYRNQSAGSAIYSALVSKKRYNAFIRSPSIMAMSIPLATAGPPTGPSVQLACCTLWFISTGFCSLNSKSEAKLSCNFSISEWRASIPTKGALSLFSKNSMSGA